MAIKISINEAKKLGYSIKGYIPIKGKSTPQPVISKQKPRKSRKPKSKNTIELIDCGIIQKLKLE